jgi:hypothetical protein
MGHQGLDGSSEVEHLREYRTGTVTIGHNDVSCCLDT